MTMTVLWILSWSISRVFEYYRGTKLLFWLAMIAIYILAVMPLEKVPELTPFNDKGNHFIAFAVLTLLFYGAYRSHYFYVALWMVLYGVFIEISQIFAVNRCGELLDVLADGIGVFMGIVIIWIGKKFIPQEGKIS